jgi:hypothetical protein
MSSHALALLQAAFGAQTLVGASPPPKRRKDREPTMEDIFNSVGIRDELGGEVVRMIEPFAEENAIQQEQEGVIAEIRRLIDFLRRPVAEFDFYFIHLDFNDAQMQYILLRIEHSQSIRRIRFNLLDEAMASHIIGPLGEQMPWITWIRDALRRNRSIRHLILYNRNILFYQHSLNPQRVLQNYVTFLNMFERNLPQTLIHIEFEDFIHTYIDLHIRDHLSIRLEDVAERHRWLHIEMSEWRDRFFRKWNTFILSLRGMLRIKIVENPDVLDTTDGLIECFKVLLGPFESIRELDIILDLSEIEIFKFIIKEMDRIHWDGVGLEIKPDGMICKVGFGEVYDIINELSTRNRTLGSIMVPYEKLRTNGEIQRGSFNWRRWQLRPMEWTDQTLHTPWVRKQRGFIKKVELIRRALRESTRLPEEMVANIFERFSEERIYLNIDRLSAPLRALLEAEEVTDDELSGKLRRFLPRRESGDIAFYMSGSPIQGIIEPTEEEIENYVLPNPFGVEELEEPAPAVAFPMSF